MAHLQGGISLLALALLLRSTRLGILHMLFRCCDSTLIRQPAAPQLHRLRTPGFLNFCLQCAFMLAQLKSVLVTKRKIMAVLAC